MRACGLYNLNTQHDIIFLSSVLEITVFTLCFDINLTFEETFYWSSILF